MADGTNVSEQISDLMELIQILETVSLRIQMANDTDELFGIINDAFIGSKRFSQVIITLNDDGNSFKVKEISMNPKLISLSEKLGKFSTKGFKISLDRMISMKPVLVNGSTEIIDSSQMIKEVFGPKLGSIIAKTVRYDKKITVNAPLIRGGRIIGAISMNSPAMSEYSVPAIKNFAMHVNLKMDLIDEHEMRMDRESSLEESRKSLKLEKRKTEFYLDLLGHDLGNMHQGIYSWLQIMEMSRDEGTHSLAYSNAKALTRSSMKMVKNVLLLSRIKDTDFKPEQQDLRMILSDVILETRALFPKRDIKVNFSYDKREGYHILAENIVSEVFFNIIHNGIKFQTQDPVVIEIDLKKKDGIIISIRDHGPGIPEELRKDLFSRGLKNFDKNRTGIGLSLVKELIERYNAQISILDRVSGDHTGGTEFRIVFPISE